MALVGLSPFRRPHPRASRLQGTSPQAHLASGHQATRSLSGACRQASAHNA